METVILKNGAEEQVHMVSHTMETLWYLAKERSMVLYELAMKCRDRNHKFFGTTGQTLVKLGLVEADGSIHDTVRNIVLSAIEGDGADLTIGSPLKE